MYYKILIYSVAVFLILYGAKSFISRIKDEKKAYWINFGYSSGLKKLLNDKYDKYNNLFWGGVSFVSGIVILIAYTIRIS